MAVHKESNNPQRRDRKKLRKLEEKTNLTQEDEEKMKILRSKIRVYDSQENPKKKEETIKVPSNDEVLEEEYQKHKNFWKHENRIKLEEKKRYERLQKEKKEKERYERLQREKEEKERYERLQKEKEEKEEKERYERLLREMKGKEDTNIPEDIMEYLRNGYHKKTFHKLILKYHPDKQNFTKEKCDKYIKIINSIKQ